VRLCFIRPATQPCAALQGVDRRGAHHRPADSYARCLPPPLRGAPPHCAKLRVGGLWRE
jgi:hypothetical protein